MCSCDILEKTWRPTKLTLMDRDDIYQSVFARIWVSCKDLDHRDWVAYFLLLATWRQIQGVQLNKQTINPHSKMFFNPLWWACSRDILEKTWRPTKLTLMDRGKEMTSKSRGQSNCCFVNSGNKVFNLHPCEIKVQYSDCLFVKFILLINFQNTKIKQNLHTYILDDWMFCGLILLIPIHHSWAQ